MQEKPYINEVKEVGHNFFKFQETFENKKIDIDFLVRDISLINIQAISSTVSFSKEEKDDRLNIILVKQDGTAEMVDYFFARKYSISRRKLIFSKFLENICLNIRRTREELAEYDEITVCVDLEYELNEIEKTFSDNHWDITYPETISAQMYDVHNSKIRDIRKTHVDQLIGASITISASSLANIEIMDNPYWKETEWFKLAFTLHSGQILYMILDISEPDPSNIGYGHIEHIEKYREFFGLDMEKTDINQLKFNIQEVIRYNLENKKATNINIDRLYWHFYEYMKVHNI